MLGKKWTKLFPENSSSDDEMFPIDDSTISTLDDSKVLFQFTAYLLMEYKIVEETKRKSFHLFHLICIENYNVKI